MSAETFKAQPFLEPIPGQGVAIEADQDHDTFAVLTKNGVGVWNVRTGERIFEAPGSFVKLYSVPGQPGRNLTFSVNPLKAQSSVVQIDSGETGEDARHCLAQFPCPAVGKQAFAVGGVPFTPANQGSPTAKIVADSLTGSRLGVIQVPTVTGELRSGNLTQAGIKALGISNDGSQVIVGTQWEDGFGQGYAPATKAIVYSMSDGNALHSFDVQQYVMDVGYDPKNPPTSK